jgi:hypothetical protein
MPDAVFEVLVLFAFTLSWTVVRYRKRLQRALESEIRVRVDRTERDTASETALV